MLTVSSTTDTCEMVTTNNTEEKIGMALEYALFMIAHEAMHNAMRHAQPQHVTVDLDVKPDRIRLAVRDDGSGFDSAAPPPAGHLGLVGMQERARWIGLKLAIDSVRGEGTTVSVEWQRP